MVKSAQPIIKAEHEGKVEAAVNPMDGLYKQGLAVRVGNGLFVLKGVLVDLQKVIDRKVKAIARQVQAEPITVPSILSGENVTRSKYLDSFKNQALMIVPYLKMREAHSECVGMNSPTVCYHYFSSLADTTLMHDHCITAIRRCTRREEGDLDDLSRLTNFTMREVVFFGTQDYCRESIARVLSLTMEFLNNDFDLQYKVVTAADPFFGGDAESKKEAQLLFHSKYEVQAALPFNKGIVSIASLNNHGKVFFDRFSIKPGDETLTHSACVGWGYERILFALLSQKGTDFFTPFYQGLLRKKV